MKKFEIVNICIGILLVMLAAFFSISLLVQFLNFGISGNEFSLIFFTLGKVLASVYGLCSILVPLFLLYAAALAFSTGWNVKNGTSLLLSFLPFFTAVLTERICREMAAFDNGPLLKIKILCTIVIGILIIVIEYLFFRILGQKISLELSIRKKSSSVKMIKVSQPNSFSGNSAVQTPEPVVTVEKVKTTSVFDHVFDSIPETPVQKTEQVTPEPVTEKEPEVVKESEIVEEKITETENPLDEKTEIKNESIEAEQEPEVAETANENSSSNDEDTIQAYHEPETITSLITPEEFNALTAPLTDSEYDDDVLNEANNDFNESLAKERTLDPDFFDVDLNTDEDLEDDDAEDDKDTVATTTNHIQGVSDVFAEMDEDARREIEDESEPSTNEDPLDDTNELIPDFPAQMANSFDEQENKKSLVENSADQEIIEEPEIENIENDMEDSINNDDLETEEIINPETSDNSEIFNKTENSEIEDSEDLEDEDNDDDEKTEIIPEVNSSFSANSAFNPEPKKVYKKFRGAYKIPVENLLTEYADDPYWVIDDETKNASLQLKDTLSEFKIDADIIGIRKGPVVTMFEMLPAPGVKLSKIVALQDNIALRLAASSVRIVAPIPGKQAVGIEVPNKNRSIVGFREIIERDLPEYKKMAVPVILGKDIEGEPQIMDLVKTPHLLIAGATGSGKSVCVNSMILSILYKRSPQQVKLILIDPKIVELKLYNDIPHLLTPVITESKKAFQALQYCLCEMERRYALLDGMGVRDISSYNKRIVERNIATEKLPYIVVIIDEFADLMATTGKELESTVARLAAMSRAIGIHIVLATQRPSIDVITGLIKANIPTRIAFMVASKMDSRIIIDQVGAEKLLGRGDMLYASAVDPFPIRIQGTFVSDNEVENVVEYVKQYGPPNYIDDEIFVEDEDEEEGTPSLFNDGDDPLYEKALDIVVQAGKASASYIQRRLKIGYNRAARLVEEMEARGIVGPQNGSKPREIIHIP